MKIIPKIFICFCIYMIVYTGTVFAQDNTIPDLSRTESLEATVTKILEEKEIVVMGKKQKYQQISLIVTKGSIKGKTITVENGTLPTANTLMYKIGDTVLISYETDYLGNTNIYITDYIRRDSLWSLFIIFVISVILIGKKRGLLSLVGMFMSFAVIFMFILPNIAAGRNPVFIAILGSLFIIPVSFFLSHGWNRKTVVAIIGTCIALVITGLLAQSFVESTKLTGFASEEAGFLESIKQGSINMKGLLMAGIIIGVLGVLDDITISQSAIVFELKKANNKFGFKDLFFRAMNIGQDHISSIVNTLVLVYSGAALPLLLLFVNNPHPFTEIVNYEIVADEIVRTLTGSIGLILAVPITTFLASAVAALD